MRQLLTPVQSSPAPGQPSTRTPRITRQRACALLLLAACAAMTSLARTAERQWLAGDSHIHSHWSPGYDRTVNPPTILKGQDAMYSTPKNAAMARQHGLAWMVTTDHGGPNHSKLNMTEAHAELMQSRKLVPEVLQFYGLELNMPGMSHHTLIIPRTDDEWAVLFEIESRFDTSEVFPVDPARNTEAARIAALTHMRSLPRLPLVFANHPSRSAVSRTRYGAVEPWELRQSNDLAPEVYRGMEGGPGHQAATLAADGSPRRDRAGWPLGNRGSYNNPGARTRGGFDPMTAIVGGLWDAMLGEGRRFWIVASSDSHVHYTETTRRGSDFWPGQFHKTYVKAERTYDDILDGLRAGRVFVAAGDLVTELDVVARGAGRSAEAGGTLKVPAGQPVTVSITWRDPDTTNDRGDNPTVHRVDLISGHVVGPGEDRDADRNDTTRVAARRRARDWTRTGDVYQAAVTLPPVTTNMYVRVRGTNTTDPEPLIDQPGENPWADLWFYSNPIFIEVE
jgi:hypothetical protein